MDKYKATIELSVFYEAGKVDEWQEKAHAVAEAIKDLNEYRGGSSAEMGVELIKVESILINPLERQIFPWED